MKSTQNKESKSSKKLEGIVVNPSDNKEKILENLLKLFKEQGIEVKEG